MTAVASKLASYWPPVLVLACIQFTHMVDFVMLMPMAGQLMRTLDLSPAQFGALVSSFTFSAAISGIIGAFFVDHWDRKKTLLLSYIGFILGTALCGLSVGYWALLAARMLTGFFGGMCSAAILAILSDIVPNEHRGTAMGVIMASFSVASIVGIPLSLLISYHAGWHISFFALALLSTLIGILGFWMIPPIKGHLNKETPHLKTAQLYQELLEILQQKKTILAFLFSVLLTFSGFLVIPMLNPYMVHNMKFPEHHLATSYFVAGLFTFITTLIIGKLSDRFGSARVFKCVAIGSILPVMLMTHLGPHSLGIVFAVSSLFMIFMSGRMIPGMTLITQVPSAKHRGSFMSLHACIQHLATAAASFICGLIVIQAPSGKILHFNWAGWLSVGCILLSLWVLNSLLPKKQSQIQ